MEPLALTPSFFHSVLANENTSKSIKSVCFSPDGKLLATGDEGGVVRVSFRTFMLAIVIVVTIVFEANAQRRTTFGSLDLGYRQGANPKQITGSYPGYLLARFLVGREIARLWVW